MTRVVCQCHHPSPISHNSFPFDTNASGGRKPPSPRGRSCVSASHSRPDDPGTQQPHLTSLTLAQSMHSPQEDASRAGVQRRRQAAALGMRAAACCPRRLSVQPVRPCTTPLPVALTPVSGQAMHALASRMSFCHGSITHASHDTASQSQPASRPNGRPVRNSVPLGVASSAPSRPADRFGSYVQPCW